MVFGDVRERLDEDAQAVRDRTVAMAVADYEPIATRLEEAYTSVLQSMEGIFSQLPDFGTNPTEDEIRLALQAWQAQIQAELSVMQSEIIGLAGELESGAITGGYGVAVSNLQAGGMGVVYSQSTLEIIQAGINIVDSQPFQDAVNAWSAYHAQEVADIVVAAVARGENPRVVARLIEDYFRSRANPQADALRLMRTTQMYAVRVATANTYRENGVSEWVWVANLGNTRTCMGCICMHGTRHPTTMALNDHHNGRCSMMPVTPTYAELGFEGGTDVMAGMTSGQDWFAMQPPDVQRAIMGPQLYEAYSQGQIPFTPDVIMGTYSNPIFGNMQRPRSNEAIFEFLGL